MRRTSKEWMKIREEHSKKMREREELESKKKNGLVCPEPLKRGKYSGKYTVPQLFFVDLDYFYFALSSGVLGYSTEFARDMLARARHIVPPTGKAGWQFGLRFDERPELKAIALLRPESSRRGFILSPHLDCEIYRRCSSPREQSLPAIMNCLRRLYFDGENPGQSHKRCEQFFTTDRNFDLRCTENHRLLVPKGAD